MPHPSELPRGAHLFLDETKAGAYLMVATWIAAEDVDRVRKAVRALQGKGQRRLHFKKLRNAERRIVVAAIRGMPVRATAVRAARLHDRRARQVALHRIAEASLTVHAARLVIELDDSYRPTDVRFIRAVNSEIDVVHLRGHEEPLLWVSDAIAWCLQRGGEWPDLVKSLLIAEV